MENSQPLWQHTGPQAPSGREVRLAKRARVALACQRCKTRKQKCDGKHPACSKCHVLGIACQYVIPSKPMPFGKNHYIASLEKRVVELEDFLAKKGLLNQVSSFTPYDLGSSEAPSDPESPGRSLPNICPDSYKDVSPGRRDSSLSDVDDHSRSSDNEKGDSMVRILRDLSLESNGGYIGATSHFTMGRLVGSIVQGKTYTTEDDLGPSQATSQPHDSDETSELRLSDVPPDVADRLLTGYMKHIATRYPVIHSTWIRDLHSRRGSITNAYERSTLHLVYAIAGRFLQTTGETGSDFFPEYHQTQVLKDLDEMLRYHDTRSVVTLLLLAVYSLRAKGGPGAWAYIGLAMRIAIDLGLHRQTNTMNQVGFDVEMRKRLFWSCYTMDRQISIPLGRPFAISDRDIDVALPFNIDEACQDMGVLERSSKLDPDVLQTESTSLTAFLHILRLRRIESSIQQSIYRVDQSTNVTDAEIEFYLEQLDKWKSLIPLDAKKKHDRESVAFDGYDYYMVFYYKCHRLLLYPLISKPQVNPRFLKACAEVCGGVAQTYKRLHQALSVGYSLMALQTVFMAGLTLIYCAWTSPEEIFSSAIINDINACSIVLFVITERWPVAKKYRDAFEAVKQSVIDPLSNSPNQEPRRAIATLPPVEVPLQEGGQEYSRIISHMSGQETGGTFAGRRLFGAPMSMDMEQVQYQLGDMLEDQAAQQYRSFHPGDSQDSVNRYEVGNIEWVQAQHKKDGETYDFLNTWPPGGLDDGMDFTVRFEPFGLGRYTAMR